MDYFAGLGLGVNIFPLTEKKLRRSRTLLSGRRSSPSGSALRNQPHGARSCSLIFCFLTFHNAADRRIVQSQVLLQLKQCVIIFAHYECRYAHYAVACLFACLETSPKALAWAASVLHAGSPSIVPPHKTGASHESSAGYPGLLGGYLLA